MYQFKSQIRQTMAAKGLWSKYFVALFMLLVFSTKGYASHGTNPVSDIDYTGMGTFSGNYTHSTTDHVWIVFNANAGNTITFVVNTASTFTHHYWLYRSNTGCVQVGNSAANGCMTLVQSGGNGVTSGTYTYSVAQTGQFAFQLDAFVGGSGSYSVTVSGSTATTTLCTPTAPSFTTCPSNISASTSGGSTSVSYTAVASSGNLTYSFSGATTGSGSGTGSGSNFNVGTTTVTITATSTCGTTSTATCSFTITVAPPAGALNFDGVDDYVRVTNPFYAFGKELTVEWSAIIDPTSDIGSGISQSTENIDGAPHMMWMMHYEPTTTSLRFWISDNGAWKMAEAAVPSGWHRFVGVASGTEIKIYMDGTLIATSPDVVVNNILNVSASVIHIGKDSRYAANRWMKGQVDEVRIWNRALCLGEIQNNATCELTGSQTGLQEYYKFNHGFINFNNAGVTTLTDHSGNGRHGTLIGFALSGTTSNWVAGVISGTCSPFTQLSVSASSNSPVNQGSTINLSATASGTNAGSATYAWSGPGFTSSNQNPSITNAQPVNAGTYTVKAHANGCGATATTTVAVNPPATALDFDGGDYVRVNNVNLPSAFTVETWVMFRQGGGRICAGDANSFLIDDNGGNQQLRLVVNTNAIFSTSNVIVYNQWMHVACVVDGANSKIFVNGADVTGAGATGGPQNVADFDIGMTGSPYFQAGLNGKIDEFRIWSRALCGGEIQNNMNCELGGAQTGLMAYYKLNQGFVNGNNSGTNTATDETGNGYTGSLVGFALNGSTSNWSTGTVSGTCSSFTMPSVSASSNSPVNQGASINLSATASGTNSGAATYAWSGPGFTSSNQNPSITNAQPSNAGTYTVKADVNGCGATATTTVVVNPAATGLDLQGGNDYVNIGSVIPGGSSYTKEAWVYATNTSCDNIISSNQDPFWMTGGRLSAGNGNNYSVVTDPSSMPVNSWVHVAVTYDRSTNTMRLYRNGIQVAVNTSSPVYAGGTIALGHHFGGGCYFQGKLDETRIWDRALCQDEIRNNMGCELSGPQTGLIAYYQLNQGFVNGNNTGFTNVIDASGNGNHGTMVNFTRTGLTSNWTVGTVSGSCGAYAAPEISVVGNSNLINDGDNTPSAADNTDFGGTNPGIAVTKSFTIKNSGTANLAVNSINISGADAGSFTVSGISLPATLAVGNTLSFDVTFNSNVPLGFKNATVTINNDDCNEGAYDFAVRGEITCAPASFTACPGNMSLNTAPGQCDQIANYIANANGTPAPAFSYTFTGATSGSGSGTGSGSTFNTGTTTVTITATNPCSAPTCSFTVTVTDNQFPALSGVPANTTVNCQSVPPPAVVTASDNCPGVSGVSYFQFPSVSVNEAHYWPGDNHANDVFGGAHGFPVNLGYAPGILGGAAFSFAGNGRIEMGTAGSLSGTGDFAVTAWVKTTSNAGMTIINQRDGGFDGEYILNIGTNHNGGVSQPGKVYFLLFSFGGGLTEVFSSASVNDGKWHHISAERNGATINIYIDGALSGSATGTGIIALNNTLQTFIGQDVRDNNKYFVGQIDNVKTFYKSVCPTAYQRNRVWTATDAAGNQSAADQNISVVDITAPALTVPANITMNAANGQCQAVVNFAATAVDNCSPDVTITYSQNPGTNFPVGSTLVNVTAKDPCGNTSLGSFKVIVNDNQNPVLACPADVNHTADAGVCSYSFTPAATATDNCAVASVVGTRSDAAALNAPYPVGTTTILWKATDIHGNSSTCTQTIIVTDDENPVITCPADVNHTADAGVCSYSFTPAATATDNCAVASVTGTRSDAAALNDPYPVGTTTILWKATDIHGNSSTCTQTIVVTDNENPVITCPADVNHTADAGVCSYSFTPAATATDNCAVASVTGTRSDAAALNAPYPVGTTTILWKATDIHGNSSTCTQTIIVTDDENPVITCPADVNHTADAGVCSYSFTPAATATDNCAVASVVGTRSDAAALNAPYPVGTTTILWKATDIHGNSSTCTQTIVVTDNENPVITCPADVNHTADAGVCSYSFTPAATATDNCAVASVVGTRSDAAALNAPYPVGTTTILWKATDIHGNSSTCTQTIVVTDNENPVASCQNYTLNLSGGTGTVTPANIDNGSTDNCAIGSMTVTPNTFTCANAGNNTVVLTVTDIHGNVSTCTATVLVQYQPTCTISVTPSNSTFTGGVATNIYLGYGPQSATITANPTGGSGFTYSWSGPTSKLSCTNCQSPVFTPTAGGTYTYTVTATNSNGCSTTCTVTFCVKDIRDGISNNPNSQKVYICHVPPGNPGNAHTLSISINAVPAHLGLHGGDMLGRCDQTCGAAAKGEHTQELLTIGEMKVYPNPTTGVFVADLPEGVKGGEVTIMDMSGRIIVQKRFLPETELRFDLSHVAQGVYMLQVVNGGQTYRARVVIQN